jgi:hypothetical protein
LQRAGNVHAHQRRSLNRRHRGKSLHDIAEYCDGISNVWPLTVYAFGMPILGNATAAAAHVTRSTSNALRIELTTPDGRELAHARQKGGAAVLLGFKNGGKGDYTLSSAAGDELQIAVAATTTITRQNTPVGRIAPANGAARFEDGGGTVLAVVQPHAGSKGDSAWHHRILSPADHELGVLTLMTVHTGWSDIESEA